MPSRRIAKKKKTNGANANAGGGGKPGNHPLFATPISGVGARFL
jgi:hypothetical protein